MYGLLLYTVAIACLIEGTRLLLPFSPTGKRVIFVLNLLAVLVAFAWLVRPSRVRQLQLSVRIRVLVLGVRVGVALLAIALAANLFGFLALSQVLGTGTLVGSFLAAVSYGVACVIGLILIAIMRSGRARTLFQLRVGVIERWGLRLVALGATLLWLRAVLRLFLIYNEVLDALSNALRYPLGFGRVHFTLGDALSVCLVSLLGYALANLLRVVLRDLLLPRLPLKHGLAYAISKLTYYFLLLLVFLAALTSGGVELNKFTVLTGGLGIGLGFGLQTIVNNFVSGLILLFERPVRIGDIVELGTLAGTVRRISVRSSTIETAQGAEVIVPNSDLLSSKLVNWTLSFTWRRVEIPVAVAYGTDPRQVLDMLVGVAHSNPDVMPDPAPRAFFMGYSDNAMKFELQFWSPQQKWFALKSDVAVSVTTAFCEAGIEIPLPQRDLHVRSIDAEVKDALAGDGVPAASRLRAAV